MGAKKVDSTTVVLEGVPGGKIMYTTPTRKSIIQMDKFFSDILCDQINPANSGNSGKYYISFTIKKYDDNETVENIFNDNTKL